jgi:hypothetical protein
MIVVIVDRWSFKGWNFDDEPICPKLYTAAHWVLSFTATGSSGDRR